MSHVMSRSLLHLLEAGDPEDAAEVGLPLLDLHEEEAVHRAAHHEAQPAQQGDPQNTFRHKEIMGSSGKS